MGSQKKKSVRKRAKMTTRDESFFGLGDIFTKDVLTAPGFAMPIKKNMTCEDAKIVLHKVYPLLLILYQNN